jgi:acyl-coenzyme A synthetase/AMP-(fatty) acid ligase
MFERILRFNARFLPDGLAISTPVGDASFAALDRDVDRMARRLQPLVPFKGFVAVQAANPGLHWVVLMALARLGCATASLPPVGERPEAELLSILGADFLITDRDVPPCAAEAFQMSTEWIEQTFKSSAEPVPDYSFADEEPVRLVLSSGTTGTPKKMVLTRQVMDARLMSGGLSRLSGKRLHVSVGLDTEIAFRAGLVAWATRSPVLYPKVGFAWGEFLLKARLECLMLVPIQLEGLLRSLPPDFTRQSLDIIVVSGALSPRLYETACARLSPNIYVTYGSTEAGYVSIGAPGRAIGPNVADLVTSQAEVEIVDDHDRQVPFGEPGRIRVRTIEMVQSYADDADTERYFKDGWFYPGDMGVQPAAGRLVIKGREGEIFDIGGLRIAPSAIEEVLLACEGVYDAAAFAVQHEGIDWPHAALVCGPECDLRAVEATLRRERPQLVVPLVVVEEIPRSERGKIRRDLLSRTFTGAHVANPEPVR